jgi:hypothetical protein
MVAEFQQDHLDQMLNGILQFPYAFWDTLQVSSVTSSTEGSPSTKENRPII